MRTLVAAARPGSRMKHFADFDAAPDQLGARRVDVGDDQKVARRRTQVNRSRRAGRRKLDGARSVRPDEVGVESPAELFIETLGALDVGDWKKRDLELEVELHRGHGFSSRLGARQMLV